MNNDCIIEYSLNMTIMMIMTWIHILKKVHIWFRDRSLKEINCLLKIYYHSEELLMGKYWMRHLFYYLYGAETSKILKKFCGMLLGDKFILWTMNNQARTVNILCFLFIIESLFEKTWSNLPVEILNYFANR